MCYDNLTGKFRQKMESVVICVKTCFLVGHRNTPSRVYDSLEKEIERHITEYGVRNFLVGCNGEFDRLATSILRTAKHKHPNIILMQLLPFHPIEFPVEKPEWFDIAYHPMQMSEVPLIKRLREMDNLAIGLSEYVIAYAHESASRTGSVVKRAVRNGLSVTILPQK